jgi:hypothetical protein
VLEQSACDHQNMRHAMESILSTTVVVKTRESTRKAEEAQEQVVVVVVVVGVAMTRLRPYIVCKCEIGSEMNQTRSDIDIGVSQTTRCIQWRVSPLPQGIARSVVHNGECGGM